MSFPRYPNYKASVVEWLGEVPGHWGVTALKRGFNVTLGKMLQPESSGPDDELLPYLRAANIQWGGVDTSDIKKMWLSKRDRAQLRLERGDLLVSEGGDVGRTCLWESELDECYFQNSVNRVRARDGHSNRYLRYWMSTIKDKGYIDVLCNKSTIAHFTAEKVSAVPTPFPPPAEQTHIAEFLDRETAKIDGLVGEQRRLMELLKEKRQAVISHAVTKGLNPHAPMKPSGIEWLGDVPEHWEVKPLKAVSKLYGRIGYRGYTTADIVDEGEGAITLSPSNMTEGVVSVLKSTYISWDKYTESPEIMIRPDDIVMVKTGSTFGKVAYVSQVDHPMTINPQLVLYKNITCFPRFLFFVLNTPVIAALIEVNNSGSTIPTMSQEAIGNFRFGLPPATEQEMIVEYVDRELLKLATLTTEAQRAIDLLQERRTALISAAVTGQIDVRPFTEQEAA